MNHVVDYSVLDATGMASFIFFPRPDGSVAPPGAEDLRIAIEPGVALGSRFYPAQPDWPTILYFHGNGEIAADHDTVAPLYHQRARANLLVVDFRGYGKSQSQPTYASLFDDARVVADWFHSELDRRGFTGRRFVMGRSLGSAPALEIAANAAERFSGLVIESGVGSVTRIAERLGVDMSSDTITALLAAHEAKLRAIRLPTLILHGSEDSLLPLAHAVELKELLAATSCELVVIPGAEHNDILWVGLQQYFDSIRAFIGGASAD